MEYFVGWDALRPSEDYGEMTTEDLDSTYIELRSIMNQQYGNHFGKIIAKQMFPGLVSMMAIRKEDEERRCEAEQYQRLLAGPKCKSCFSLLIDGACEKCTGIMLRLLVHPHVYSPPRSSRNLMSREQVFWFLHRSDMASSYPISKTANKWAGDWIEAEGRHQLDDINERHAEEYRMQMDCTNNGEALDQQPINPHDRPTPTPSVAHGSRFARLGRWIRKKFLCGF